MNELFLSQPERKPTRHSGQFQPGHSGNLNGKNVSKGWKLHSALMAACHAEDYRQIAQKLISMAKAGDVRAIKELFERTLPKQTQYVEARVESLTPENVVIKIDTLLGIIHEATAPLPIEVDPQEPQG